MDAYDHCSPSRTGVRQRLTKGISSCTSFIHERIHETGIPPSAVEVIGYLDDYPTITRYMVTPVVALVEDLPQVKPSAREVAEIFEVPLPFVLDPKSFERKFFTRDGLNVPFFELNHSGYRIWGATAGMLWNLSQKFTAHETES